MRANDFESDLRRMATSSTPASIGLLAEISTMFIKALREKLLARDERMAALESRLDRVQRELSDASRAIAALARK